MRANRATRRRAAGTTTVEFAIVGAVLFMMMFAIVEFGRILFTLHVLDEGARRAARVAVVCPVNDAQISNAALFMTLPGTPPTVTVTYLDQNGASIASPGAGGYAQIRYVRVQIAGYQMPLAIPFIAPTFDAPPFTSTLPRESLGVPNFGAAPAC